MLSNKFSKLAVLCAALLLISQSALAEQNDGPFFGKEAKGKWIVGVKAAKIDANSDFVDDADAVGIVLGYEFFRVIGDAGGSSTVEFEYLKADETPILGFGDYEAEMANLFFTYRTAGKLYFKAKLGASFSEITVVTPAFDDTVNDVSLAGGIGLGYHIGDYGVVELEYSDDAGNNDLGVLGFNALLEF